MIGPLLLLFGWWRQALWESLPASWRRAQAVPGNALVFDRDADGLHVSRYRRGWLTGLGRISLSDPAADTPDALANEEWQAMVTRHPSLATSPVILRMAADDTVRLRARVARRDYVAAAVVVIEPVIRRHLGEGEGERLWVAADRSLLPGSEDVDLDVHVAEAKPLAAARRLVEQLIAWDGVQPFLTVPSGAGAERWSTSALVAQGSPLPHDKVVKILPYALVAILVLAVIAGVSPLVRQQARLALLEREVAAQSEAAEDSLRISGELNALTLSWQNAIDQRRRKPYLVSILNAVSRRLPDDSSLVQFYVSERAITLGGTSGSSDTLPDLLAADPLFSSARHRFEPTYDPVSRRHHVQLTVVLDDRASSGDESP